LDWRRLFDHLVGLEQQRRRYREANLPSGAEIDGESDLGRVQAWERALAGRVRVSITWQS